MEPDYEEPGDTGVSTDVCAWELICLKYKGKIGIVGIVCHSANP